MRARRTLAAMVAALSSLMVGAQDFYVSPTGSDNAPGTGARPWKTLEYAFERIQGATGDARLIVEDGEYALGSKLLLQGISGRSVRIEAAPGASPRVRGDRKVLRLTRLKDKNVLERIDHQARGHILEASLRGVGDLGNPCSRSGLFDLYHNGRRQRLSRYPNEGFIKAGEVLGETPTDPSCCKEGVFAYREDRISSWAAEKDAYIYGYFRWDWSDQYQRVEAIDTEARAITLEGPWHHYGYKSGFRYYGINLLCELDAPGEYYVDRVAGKLYWYPPEDYSPGDEVSFSAFGEDCMLEIKDCEKITVAGLNFEGGRGDAIHIEASKEICLDGIGAFRFGGDALSIRSSKDIRVEGCGFGVLGHSGIQASGGDRKTLEKANYTIDNTIIKDFSLFKHTYEPAVYFEGCGLTISHCEFSGSSSSAMRIDGSEALIEYNHLHDLVRESDDQGGLDMFFNYGYRGVIIRYNLWEDILGGSLHGAAGVRFDDMISGQTVYGNIFRNVGALHFGAVQIHGGKDNVVDNNIFYRCHVGVSFSPWGQEQWDRYLERDDVRRQLHEDVDIESPLYQGRFPVLREDIHGHVDRNIIRNNLAIGCGRMFYKETGQNHVENNHGISIGENPVVKPLEYYLNPEVLASFGLKPIPYKEIGPTWHRVFK